jgi:hypothetical protein
MTLYIVFVCRYRLCRLIVTFLSPSGLLEDGLWDVCGEGDRFNYSETQVGR